MDVVADLPPPSSSATPLPAPPPTDPLTLASNPSVAMAMLTDLRYRAESLRTMLQSVVQADYATAPAAPHLPPSSRWSEYLRETWTALSYIQMLIGMIERDGTTLMHTLTHPAALLTPDPSIVLEGSWLIPIIRNSTND
mgnify:FL=1